jgi:acetoin utilization protein AcuB
MFVSKSMAKTLVTVSPKDSVFVAKDKMKENQIRHLPVVEDGDRLVGMVTDRDIRSALPRTFFSGADTPEARDAYNHLSVGNIMTTDLITVPPTYTIQDALLLIQEKRVGAFPVVEEGDRLKGIISIRDLLRAFINVLGIGEPGVLLGILVKEEVGQLKKIVDAITELNVSFGSILVARYWEEGMRAVFVYLLTVNIVPIKRELTRMGFRLIDPMDWDVDEHQS